MNKKFLIAWLVMFVLYFAFGFIVHGVLLHDDYAGNGHHATRRTSNRE